MRMTYRLGLVVVLVLGCVVGAVAQNPPAQPTPQPRQPGFGPGAMRRQRLDPQNPDQAALIRARIEERWGQRVQQELGLNDQQMERLRTVGRANEDRVRETGRREAEMMRAVMEQLRPGVAANGDSLGRLLDGIAAARVQRAQSEQQELRELSQFLNPVQRARLLLMRRQLMQWIDNIRTRGGAPGMAPGPAGPPMGPGMGPMRPGVPRDTVDLAFYDMP